MAGQTIPSLTVGCGIWIVGLDIPSGTYDILAFVSENYGNYSFSIFDEDTEFFGPGSLGNQISMFGFGNKSETKASNITLTSGEIIITDGCMATFSVADENVYFGP